MTYGEESLAQFPYAGTLVNLGSPGPASGHDGFYMASNVGPASLVAPSDAVAMNVNVGLTPPVVDRDTALMEVNVGIESATMVFQGVPQIGWGSPLVGSDEVRLIEGLAKAVTYLDINVTEEEPAPIDNA